MHILLWTSWPHTITFELSPCKSFLSFLHSMHSLLSFKAPCILHYLSLLLSIYFTCALAFGLGLTFWASWLQACKCLTPCTQGYQQPWGISLPKMDMAVNTLYIHCIPRGQPLATLVEYIILCKWAYPLTPMHLAYSLGQTPILPLPLIFIYGFFRVSGLPTFPNIS